MFTLEVKCLLCLLLPFRRVLERVPVKRVEIRATGRRRDDACMLIRRRLDSRKEGWNEQLGEVVVADDVRAPLQVVPILR